MVAHTPASSNTAERIAPLREAFGPLSGHFLEKLARTTDGQRTVKGQHMEDVGKWANRSPEEMYEIYACSRDRLEP